MAKCLSGRLSGTKHRTIRDGLNWMVRPWPLFSKIAIFSCILLFSSPFWCLCVNTHCFLQRVLTGAPDLAETVCPPPPPLTSHTLMHHVHFSPHQMQVQIRGSDTLVKPAGLKPYVSLPSTCMQVLTFPVCSHSLLQWAYLSLQDIGLQQEPGTDDGLYGEGHTGSNHRGSLSGLVQEGKVDLLQQVRLLAFEQLGNTFNSGSLSVQQWFV